MELLIYKRDYQTSYKKGDIVEVREDGFWLSGARGYNKEAFIVVQVPGKVDEKYIEPKKTLITKKVTDKRKWKYTGSLDKDVVYEKSFINISSK